MGICNSKPKHDVIFALCECSDPAWKMCTCCNSKMYCSERCQKRYGKSHYGDTVLFPKLRDVNYAMYKEFERTSQAREELHEDNERLMNYKRNLVRS